MTPFAAIESMVPRAGSVLDVGCGHGVFSLWLAQASPDRTVHGVDVAVSKLGHAHDAVVAAGLDGRVSFARIGPGWEPAVSDYDAAVVADVIYLLDERDAASLIKACCRALRPGGTLVIKEVADTPRWKHAVGLAQEWIAVRGLRLTQGTGFNPRPMDTARSSLIGIGWGFREVRLDRGYPYSHAALVASRPR